jgi:hypothetical protein
MIPNVTYTDGNRAGLAVNEVLRYHLLTGGGAARYLRSECSGLVPALEAFFATRTDVRRLAAAQDVAACVLDLHDLDDLNGIREIVAKQELRRTIRYKNQRDHTAHTLYLYLLGIWLFDNVPQVAKAVKVPVRDFLFRWAYASLLHDIGYVFYDLQSETLADRKDVDALFGLRWLHRSVHDRSADVRAALKSVRQDWWARYGSALPRAREGESETAVLDRLAMVPWAGDLWRGWKGLSAFGILDPAKKYRLQAYAYEVAKRGLPLKNGGRSPAHVDHAVGSGLLLFQYTSYWYWIYKKLRAKFPDAFEKARARKNMPGTKFRYDIEDLLDDITPACQSVAVHNIKPGEVVRSPKPRLERDAITYLGILCDDLQKWDRLPVGETYTRGFMDYAREPESDDVRLECAGEESRRAALTFRDANLVVKLKDELGAKLTDFKKIVWLRAFAASRRR